MNEFAVDDRYVFMLFNFNTSNDGWAMDRIKLLDKGTVTSIDDFKDYCEYEYIAVIDLKGKINNKSLIKELELLENKMNDVLVHRIPRTIVGVSSLAQFNCIS